MFPKESNEGLWGGEGVVRGFQKRHPLRRRVPHYWFPMLLRSAIYSEVLNKHMSVVVTKRALDLIHKNYGLDHYILKVNAILCVLREIKKRMAACENFKQQAALNHSMSALYGSTNATKS